MRFDTDLGKHGDTGDSELRVIQAVAEGAAEAGALGEPTLAAFRAERVPAVADLEVAWRSPTYYHCNFTRFPRWTTVSRSAGRRPSWPCATTTPACARRWISRE